MNVSRFLARKTYFAFRKSLIRNIISISIITTSLSVTVMIVASSVFEGFQQQIAAKVFGFWGHIHITDVHSSRSIEAIPLEDVKSIKDSVLFTDYHSLGYKDCPIQSVNEFAVIPGIISKDGEYEGLFLKGINSNFNWKFLSQFLKQGRNIEFNDSTLSRDIILSEQISKKLNVKLNDEIKLHFFIDNKHIQRKLKICGIYRTGLEEYDKKFVLVDIKLIQQILQWDQQEVSGLEVFVKDIPHVEALNYYLYKNILPSSAYSETIRNKFPNIFEWLSLQDINKRFILGIILLVCIINMSTTLLILIMSRTQMIGLLNSLGMSIWDQRKIFINYGIRILVRGMLFGNIIGLGVCLLQYKFKFIKLSEADYYLDHAPISLNPSLIVTVNGIFFLIIILNLLIPSYLVAKINPVKALKFR